jgi:antirestriction protein ArdC
MICAELGLPTELHDGHASYIGSWLSCLRADKSALFTAASKADQAFNYLRAFSRPEATAAPQKLAA